MLEILAKHHEEWIKIVRSFGEHNYYEDIVQDMYIKCSDLNLFDRFIEGDKVHKPYVWFMLRSMFLNYKKSQVYYLDVTELKLEYTDVNQSYEDAYNELTYNLYISLMDLDKDDKYPYNKELFKLYALTDMSLQDIENEVGISKRSAHYTIDKCRKKLRSKLENLYNEIN